MVYETPVASIRRVEFDHGNGMRTAIETADARNVINRIDLHEEEFEVLQCVLLHLNPAIKIDRW